MFYSVRAIINPSITLQYETQYERQPKFECENRFWLGFQIAVNIYQPSRVIKHTDILVYVLVDALVSRNTFFKRSHVTIIF